MVLCLQNFYIELKLSKMKHAAFATKSGEIHKLCHAWSGEADSRNCDNLIKGGLTGLRKCHITHWL